MQPTGQERPAADQHVSPLVKPGETLVVRVLGAHPFKPRSMRWRAATIVTAMDGGNGDGVIDALTN